MGLAARLAYFFGKTFITVHFLKMMAIYPDQTAA